MKLLRDAITEIGTAPCDDCPYAQRCRDEHLACEVFAQWVNSSQDEAEREPTRKIYDRVFV